MASALIRDYEQLFKLKHDNIVQVFGICPTSGYIAMWYCQMILHNHTIRTLGDLLAHCGDDLPVEHRIMALSDIAEGLQYIRSNGLVHGDIKPHNILVAGSAQKLLFKITDYACYKYKTANQFSSRSCSLKQLMTPGYLVPELINDVGNYLDPTKASNIYSFSILAYEVAFVREPWSAVNLQLIESVRRGSRPVVPNNGSSFIFTLMQNCWKQDSLSRPSASYVSQSIQDYLESSSPQIFDSDSSKISLNQNYSQLAASSVVETVILIRALIYVQLLVYLTQMLNLRHCLIMFLQYILAMTVVMEKALIPAHKVMMKHHKTVMVPMQRY